MGWTKKDTDGYGTTVDWDEVSEFVGTFVSSKEIETKFGENTVYRFTGTDGEAYEIWGSAALNRGLEDVSKGDLVRIEYKGMVKAKGGKRAHTFDVFVSDGDDDDTPRKPAKKAAPAAKKAASKRKADDDDDDAY